jgi:hypothetical protein
VVADGFDMDNPALFTTRSTPPKDNMAAAMAFSICVLLVTSNAMVVYESFPNCF